MMNRKKMRLGMLAGAALAFMSSTVLANVMVYDVQVNGSDISYRVLDAADSVIELEVFGPLPATTVVGTETLPNAEGLNTFEFDGTAGGNPTTSGEQYGFRINASKATGYLDYSPVIDTSTDPAYNFESPRGGVAIDIDPESDTFGTLYIGNTRTTSTGAGRTMAAGIYALFPDGSDPIGHRDTPATGGVDWTLSATASPWKAKVGPDGFLYISDWSDAHAGLWRAPLDLSGTWEEVLDNTGRDTAGLVAGLHGSVAGIFLEQDGADVVVYWQDEDLATSTSPGDGRRNIYSVTITPSTVLPITGTSTLVVDENSFAAHPLFDPNPTGNLGMFVNDVGGGLEKDNDGNFWISNFRATGDNWPCLMKIDPTGDTMLWDSRTGGTAAALPEADPFAGLQAGFAIDEINNKLYGATPAGFTVLDLSQPLPDSNIPAAVTAVEITSTPTFGSHRGGINHDAAGNIYVVTNVVERLFIYSPPGPNSFSFERASLTLAGGAPLSAEKNWVEYK